MRPLAPNHPMYGKKKSMERKIHYFLDGNILPLISTTGKAVAVNHPLSSHVPSMGTNQWNRGAPSQQSSQEVDVFYINGKHMCPHLEVLLLWVPHMEYILQQSLMRHHTRCAEEHEEAVVPHCGYTSRISFSTGIIIIMLSFLPYHHFRPLKTSQKPLMH